MPELPEVETVRRGLEKAISGARIVKVTLRRAGLRIPFPENLPRQLAGRTIVSVGRRAKYLLFSLDSGDVLVAHLGMSGKFILLADKPETWGKHDHVVMALADGRWLVFNDARRFGLMTLARGDELEKLSFFTGMGPEPFSGQFSPEYLKSKLSARSMPVKPALMDQALVVGVGNIYASEALYLAGIHPRTPAKKAAKHAAVLVQTVCRVLDDAIRSGGSSLRDFVQLSGEEGHFQHRFNVYGRAGKPCPRCAEPIKTLRQAGRSTFFCPGCQR